MIREYDEAVAEFDACMKQRYDTEVERLEAQRKHLALLATNSGRQADYFILPKFLKQSTGERHRDKVR